jgi:hypothetical protein
MEGPLSEMRDGAGQIGSIRRMPLSHAFNSRLRSFKKRQSVPSVMSWFGLESIMPASCRRSPKKRSESSGSSSRHCA